MRFDEVAILIFDLFDKALEPLTYPLYYLL